MLEVSERARQLLVVTIVVHVICTINGLSISNEDSMVYPREIRIWIIYFISILMQDCAVEAGKQQRRIEPVIDSDLS